MTLLNDVFAELPCPYAWLDYDALDHNIHAVQQQCGHKSIRIATKSVRSISVLRYIANRLPNCSGFMTFSAAETVYLLEQQFNHLLVGYPVYEEDAIRQIGHFIRDGKDVTLMVDHVDQLQLLEKIAQELNIVFPVCIDINVSTDYKVLYFGSQRSPITSMLRLKQFVRTLATFPRLHVVGMMAYDAQIAGINDRSDKTSVKYVLIRALKKQAVQKITTFREQAVAYVKQHYTLQFVNVGGTGSMHIWQQAPDATEITVGSAFYAPALFSHYDALSLAPAVGFTLRITRKFSPHVFVCHGGGYIASGAIDALKAPAFLEPQHYTFLPNEGAGEVQTPIQTTKNHAIGDHIFFRHAKAGELCERFHVLHTTRNGNYTGPISTYRGDGQCFL